MKSLTFNDGRKIPIFGLGTWLSEPGQVKSAVIDAINSGYRHIDCAHCYQNEGEVGAGLKAKLDDGTIKREDIFITSKLWITFFRKDLVIPALKHTLKNLGLEYLDLYLLHWPFTFKEESGLFPKDSNDKIIGSSADYVDAWAQLEEAQKMGLVRSIGISNFNKSQVERLCANCTVVPAINQVECHPYLNQRRLIDFCRTKGIAVGAYSSLGNPQRPSYSADIPAIMQNPSVIAMSKKYNKNPGQLLIRFQIQRGIVVIPKSVKKERIETNFQVFDFEISADDMAKLEGMDRNLRYLCFDMTSHLPQYPFNEPY